MSVLETRICALFSALNTGYVGGSDLSSAAKGNEREQFVQTVLNNAFPPHYRFSSGDIVDSYGKKSGQVDIVLEQPRSYSFPLLSGGPRLYLAESVAAVIEVKSDLSNQWNEVIATANKLAEIKRKFSSESLRELLETMESGRVKFENDINPTKIKANIEREIRRDKNIGSERIPFFVVGFKGWAKDETMCSKLVDNRIDGILQIDRKIYCTKLGYSNGPRTVQGYKSLLSLIHWLEIYFHKVPERFSSLQLY